MDFENESSPPPTSLKSSSSSSVGQEIISSCTPAATLPNPNPRDSSSQPSHKRKAGRKKFRETRHPVYRGVRQRNGNKWVCEIREPNKKSRIWVGTYPTPEMAARAHDVAVLALRGTSADFNFPDSAFLLPLPRSCSPRDIRAAAAQATEAFKPNTVSSEDTETETADPCPVEEIKNHERGLSSCLKISMHGVEGTQDNDESKTAFFDEEAVYNMPGLLDSMAEGLLITPPPMNRAMDWDDIGYELDLTLWTNL